MSGKSHFLPLIKQFHDWKLKGTKYSYSSGGSRQESFGKAFITFITACLSGSSKLEELSLEESKNAFSV